MELKQNHEETEMKTVLGALLIASSAFAYNGAVKNMECAHWFAGTSPSVDFTVTAEGENTKIVLTGNYVFYGKGGLADLLRSMGEQDFHPVKLEVSFPTRYINSLETDRRILFGALDTTGVTVTMVVTDQSGRRRELNDATLSFNTNLISERDAFGNDFRSLPLGLAYRVPDTDGGLDKFTFEDEECKLL